MKLNLEKIEIQTWREYETEPEENRKLNLERIGN